MRSGHIVGVVAVTGAALLTAALIATHSLYKRRRGGVDGQATQGREFIGDGDELLKKVQSDEDFRATTTTVVLRSAKELPVDQLARLRHLALLDVSGCGLATIPSSIGQLKSLKVFLAPRNNITQLPLELGSLSGLTQLDLAGNQLTAVPPEVVRGLTSLVTLNLMANRITELPSNFGDMTALRLLGLKSNKLVHLPDSFSRLTGLVELFITDNKLVDLPEGMSQCTSLVKLQASFNAFTALPPCLLHLPRLELLRVAVCNITSLPDGAEVMAQGAFPRLAWFSVAGNPVCPAPPAPLPDMPLVNREELDLGQKLGDGASGEVYRAVWRGQLVAVKFFRADVSPDGRTEDEVALAVGLQHPHLTQVLARVRQPAGLVLRMETGSPLALKPTSQHLLRCKWADDTRFTARRAVVLASSVADALRYCHSVGVCHGDVYAHNVLMDEDGATTLCDFGASFAYDRVQQPLWEAMEVRAYGLLLRDVAQRCKPELGGVGAGGQGAADVGMAAAAAAVAAGLEDLAARCTDLPPNKRPSFAEVAKALGVMHRELAA